MWAGDAGAGVGERECLGAGSLMRSENVKAPSVDEGRFQAGVNDE